MPKFIYLYRGPAAPIAERTAEQAADRAASFSAWMTKVGSALIDVGRPFGDSVSVRGDGTQTSAQGLIGYTIVEATDLRAAAALTDGLPFLAEGRADCAVDIFELLTM